MHNIMKPLFGMSLLLLFYLTFSLFMIVLLMLPFIDALVWGG